jgi:hypothetical protein
MSAVAVHAPRRLRSVDTPARVQAPITTVAPSASGRRSLVLALSTAIVIVAAVFGVVGLTALAADGAVAARSLEIEVAASERRYAELVAAVATKEDPSRIRALALEMGLVPSPAARHLILARSIDADGARRPSEAGPSLTDPLKPILTQER